MLLKLGIGSLGLGDLGAGVWRLGGLALKGGGGWWWDGIGGGDDEGRGAEGKER